MNISVLYYDKGDSTKKVSGIIERVKNVTQAPVIAIPKEYDLLLDVNIDRLVELRQVLDTCIKIKLETENSTKLYN